MRFVEQLCKPSFGTAAASRQTNDAPHDTSVEFDIVAARSEVDQAIWHSSNVALESRRRAPRRSHPSRKASWWSALPARLLQRHSSGDSSQSRISDTTTASDQCGPVL